MECFITPHPQNSHTLTYWHSYFLQKQIEVVSKDYLQHFFLQRFLKEAQFNSNAFFLSFNFPPWLKTWVVVMLIFFSLSSYVQLYHLILLRNIFTCVYIKRLSGLAVVRIGEWSCDQ
jgi:hypothetical protein